MLALGGSACSSDDPAAGGAAGLGAGSGASSDSGGGGFGGMNATGGSAAGLGGTTSTAGTAAADGGAKTAGASGSAGTAGGAGGTGGSNGMPNAVKSTGCGGKGNNAIPIQNASGSDAIVVGLDYSAAATGRECFMTEAFPDPEVNYVEETAVNVGNAFCVDKSRLFIEGFSSGSWISYLMGCVGGGPDGLFKGSGTATGNWQGSYGFWKFWMSLP